MKHKPYKKIFYDLHKLKEMLTLWQTPMWHNLSALARKYSCNHSSILYQIKKYGLWKELQTEKFNKLNERILLESSIPVKEKRKCSIFVKKGFCVRCGIKLVSYYAGNHNNIYCESCLKDLNGSNFKICAN